jgi:antitoxin MazE
VVSSCTSSNSAGGGFQALPYDPDFEKTMSLAEEVMDEYRDALATLAK